MRPRAVAAFTMVEIAICLAIIAFALVAIIGVLPMGLGVQKENREETIINQDASYFLDAIRSGAMGLDDLTNYVFAITNYWTEFPSNAPPSPGYDGCDRFGSRISSLPTAPQFPLTTGYRIVGLLGTPTFTTSATTGNSRSNYVVAFVRSLSGPAVEKFPQNNLMTLDMAFGYRMICQNVPATVPVPVPVPFPPPTAPNYPAYLAEVNLQTNLHELRLRFLWPLLPGGNTGDGRQTFRTLVSGSVLNTNDYGYPPGVFNLYFFQPRSFVQATP